MDEFILYNVLRIFQVISLRTYQRLRHVPAYNRYGLEEIVHMRIVNKTPMNLTIVEVKSWIKKFAQFGVPIYTKDAPFAVSHV